ncbi:MAG: hypothetical protein CO108_05760, partial [Deltaproteobacteria bacterium CG_4_9_14_3_um_filter_63_12]
LPFSALSQSKKGTAFPKHFRAKQEASLLWRCQRHAQNVAAINGLVESQAAFNEMPQTSQRAPSP